MRLLETRNTFGGHVEYIVLLSIIEVAETRIIFVLTNTENSIAGCSNKLV